MTNGWHIGKFGDVLEPVSRPVQVEADKVYRNLGVQWYAKGLFAREEKPGHEIRAKELYRVEIGDLVYNRLFAWKGSFAIAEEDTAGGYVSGEFPCFRVNTKRANAKYLHLYLSQEKIWNEIERTSTGQTSISRLRLKEPVFLEMEIPLPPLDEQHRIVEHVESLVTRITKAQSLHEESAKESRILLDSASAECFKKIKTWRKLGDHLFDLIYRYPTFYNVMFTDTGVGLLKISNLTQQNWTIDFETKKEFIDEETSKRFPQTILESGDLVMAVRGATIGKTAYVSEKYAGFNINANLLRLKPNHKLLDGKFFWYFMKSQTGQNQFQQLVTSTAKQTITVPKLKTIEVPVPSLDEQRVIVKYLDGLQIRLGQLRNLQDETQRELDALMPSVLDKAFRGEL